jgi:type IV pilus assembly protein PilN
MIRINLAPSEGRPRRAGGGPRLSLRMPEFNLGMLFVVLYLGTAAGLGFWWWTTTSREADLAMQLSAANNELTVLKQRVGQVGKVREQVAELKKRIDALEQLTKSQARPVVLFDALADVVPRDLWLTGLEERGNTLRITGTSYSTTAVADFMANLRSSGRFKDVDIVTSRQDITKTPRLVTFEVTCRFES